MTDPCEPCATSTVGDAGSRVPVWSDDKAGEERLMLESLGLNHRNVVCSRNSLRVKKQFV